MPPAAPTTAARPAPSALATPDESAAAQTGARSYDPARVISNCNTAPTAGSAREARAADQDTVAFEAPASAVPATPPTSAGSSMAAEPAVPFPTAAFPGAVSQMRATAAAPLAPDIIAVRRPSAPRSGTRAKLLAQARCGLLLAAALGALLPLFAAPAVADCALSGETGVTVACDAPFDARLVYDPTPGILILRQSSATVNDGAQRRVTDLQGDDTIALDGTGADANTLAVFTEGTGPTGATLVRSLDLMGGDDTVSLNGARLIGTILGGEGDDTYSVFEGASVALDRLALEDNGVAFRGGPGNDSVTVEANTDAFFRFAGGPGEDSFRIFGTIGVPQAAGFDQTNEAAIEAGAGDDLIVFAPSALISGLVDGGAGDDEISVEASVLPFDGDNGFTVVGGEGNDRITIGSAARIEGVLADTTGPDLAGVEDDDVIVIEAGARIDGPVLGGRGADVITSSGTLLGPLVAGDGDDTVTMLQGAVEGVFGGPGGEAIDVGTDAFTFAGGSILGPVDGFESVVIDESLFDPAIDVLPSAIRGVGVDVAIANSDLAERSAVAGTVFEGVGTLRLDASTYALSGEQDIALLQVVNGSRLRIDGAVGIAGGEDGGALIVEGSRLSLDDGDPTDVLDVGTFRTNAATIGVDVNPTTGTSDTVRITAPLEDPYQGDNILEVNLTEPIAASRFVVPIATIIDELPPGDDDPLAESFTVIGIGENVSPLVALALVQGPGGGLFLRAEEEAVLVEAPTLVNSTATTTASDAVGDVNTETLDNEVGFSSATAANRVQFTPQFGIFANGQFGRVEHDGFEVSGGGQEAGTPGFTSDNFSLIVTGEADATTLVGLEDEDIGVKVSVFGGYVLSDVTLDRAAFGEEPTPFEGTGRNQGGVIGASVLASRIVGEGNLNYGLLSAAGFFGTTEITNADTGGEGDYGTRGVVVSGKLGRNMPLDDRFRLDLRFGASYAAFYGDGFVDSTDVEFGDTETRFGVLSFEPGISTTFLVGETVVSPSARMLFHHRVGYENTGAVNGTDFDFDDADFTFGGQIGANATITDRFSAGAFIEGRVSGDQRSLLAKLAVKYVFAKN